MHILVCSMSTKATRRKAAVHYASHSLSRGNLKNIMPRCFTLCASFTAAVPSTIITKRCVLYSTNMLEWSKRHYVNFLFACQNKLIAQWWAGGHVYDPQRRTENCCEPSVEFNISLRIGSAPHEPMHCGLRPPVTTL